MKGAPRVPSAGDSPGDTDDEAEEGQFVGKGHAHRAGVGPAAT